MNIRQDPAGTAGASDARAWTQILLRYRDPSLPRSIIELGITFGPLGGCCGSLMWLSYSFGYWWLTLLLAIPAAGFLVRLFMIQHDCGHGAFFRHRLANDWIGRALGVLTLTPYDFWRRTHSVHHATSGNLERRGMGDIDTLTVREYLALSRWGRLKYRLYRHPAVMFGIGPAYLFIVQHRLPVGLMRAGCGAVAQHAGHQCGDRDRRCRRADLADRHRTLSCWCICRSCCWRRPWACGCSTCSISSSTRVWDDNDNWDLHEVALHGSSYYVLPGILSWFTANIGIHHVHHLCSRIPYYRLPRVLREHPELGAIGRLTLWDSIKCVRLVLWDESAKKLISFREMRRLRASPQSAL